MVKRADVPNLGPSEQILEVRHRPNPKVLDYRGSWADVLSQALALPKWNIVANKFDVFNEDDKHRVFVSFRNFGVIAKDPPTANYFADQANRFLRELFNLTGFDHPVHVERFGLRLRKATPFQGSFDELRDRVAERYVNVTAAAVAAIGSSARLVDIGAPLNYTDELGHFNTHCGPMEREQLTKFFKDRDSLPEVSLYYDIDYWTKPNAVVPDQDLIRRVASCANAAWARLTRVTELVLTD